MEVWFGGTSLTDASSCLGPSGRMDRPLVTPACGYWMLIRLVVALSFSDRAAAAGFRFVVASSFLDLAATGGVTSHVHHAQELLQVREAVDLLLFFSLVVCTVFLGPCGRVGRDSSVFHVLDGVISPLIDVVSVARVPRMAFA